MARPLRIEYEGAHYHVTTRGNGRKAIFRDDIDRLKFIELLGRAVEQFGIRVHAYVLMDNHYHLLIETRRAGGELFDEALWVVGVTGDRGASGPSFQRGRQRRSAGDRQSDARRGAGAQGVGAEI